MREYLFDDWRSVIHFIFGLFLFSLVLLGLGPIAAVLFLAYVLYEVHEYERPVATVGDVEEAVIGYLFGHMAAHADTIFKLLRG